VGGQAAAVQPWVMRSRARSRIEAVWRRWGTIDRRADHRRRPRPGVGAKLVRSTHERPDGTGSPNGLSGDQIPLGARIIAVVDAFSELVVELVWPSEPSPAVAGDPGGS
jgi:HD domain